MAAVTGTLLIPHDPGDGWGTGRLEGLVESLHARLRQPVLLCDADESETAIVDAIGTLAKAGVDQVVAIPLGLATFPEHGWILRSFARAGREWPALRIHKAAPLTGLEWCGWLKQTAYAAARELNAKPSATAIVLVGEGTSGALANAELARLGHLLLETSELARVGCGYAGGGRPRLFEAMRDLARLGARQIVVMPWMIAGAGRLQKLHGEVAGAAQTLAVDALLAAPTLADPALVDLLAAHHCAALSDEALQPARGAVADSSAEAIVPTASGSTAPTSEERIALEQLERRTNALLPPQYHGRYEQVRPKSMGSAGLKYDEEGRVAWDQIWTSFCDLALAGGPPHRGTLLEAPTADEALAQPDQYRSVVEEIERGIRMITGLPIVASRTPGWIGVRCASEEMAVWLMRAISVENVMVRREAETLYLPAGPRFTINREIKNVITTVAKTVHYWSAHLRARPAIEIE